MGYGENGYHQSRMIALAMIVISRCSCGLVKSDREGDGWNVWEAVALWLKNVRDSGWKGWGYVGLKMWTWRLC